jgi:hypothetical protein
VEWHRGRRLKFAHHAWIANVVRAGVGWRRIFPSLDWQCADVAVCVAGLFVQRRRARQEKARVDEYWQHVRDH